MAELIPLVVVDECLADSQRLAVFVKYFVLRLTAPRRSDPAAANYRARIVRHIH